MTVLKANREHLTVHADRGLSCLDVAIGEPTYDSLARVIISRAMHDYSTAYTGRIRTLPASPLQELFYFNLGEVM